MPKLHAESGHDRAVTPIVAVLLLLAITVVLASVMYVTVSQLMPSTPTNPSPLGVVVDRAGTNWILNMASVSAAVSPSHVYISISDPNGTLLLPYTPIADVPGYDDSDPTGILSVGDRILLPLQTYPEGSSFAIKDDQKMLFNGVLRV